MKRQVIVDTGVIVAYLKRQDNFHSWGIKQWQATKPPLFTCEAVIVEACFLLHNTYGGEQAVMTLLDRGTVKLAFQLSHEIQSVRELMQQYQSIPMSLADACLVRMTEMYPNRELLTLDSDFTIYRKNRHEIITLIMP